MTSKITTPLHPRPIGIVQAHGLDRHCRGVEIALIVTACGHIAALIDGQAEAPRNIRDTGHMVAFDVQRGASRNAYLIEAAAWREAVEIALRDAIAREGAA